MMDIPDEEYKPNIILDAKMMSWDIAMYGSLNITAERPDCDLEIVVDIDPFDELEIKINKQFANESRTAVGREELAYSGRVVHHVIGGYPGDSVNTISFVDDNLNSYILWFDNERLELDLVKENV